MEYIYFAEELNVTFTLWLQLYRHRANYSMLSTAGSTSSSAGMRLTRREALPLIKRRESLWKRWRTSICSSSPRWRASTAPSFLICSTVTLCQPPSVLAATGMKAIPSCRQASPTLATFLSNALPTAKPSDWNHGSRVLQLWQFDTKRHSEV